MGELSELGVSGVEVEVGVEIEVGIEVTGEKEVEGEIKIEVLVEALLGVSGPA